MSNKFPGQSDEQKSTVDQAVEAPESTHNPSRRKFARASVIAPVVLSVGARPAFANMCSISGGGSPGSNQEQPEACLGCTPGIWKARPWHWPTGYSIGSCTPMSPGNGVCTDYFNDGTSFDDVFTGGQSILLSLATMGRVELGTDGTTVVRNPSPTSDYFVRVNSSDVPLEGHFKISLMQVLWLEGKSGHGPDVALAYHLVAAFLNASVFPFEYGYNAADIIKLYDDAMVGNFPDGISDREGLKNVLDVMNNRGCRLSGNSNPKPDTNSL